MEQFFQTCEWRLVDESNLQSRSPLASFAMDDTLCHLVGHQLTTPTIRTWVHKESVVLGIQDHRLPFIEQGMHLLNAQGYTPIVRNSGGLAVVLDPGVLNISLVLLAFRYFLCYTLFIGGLPYFVCGVFNFISNLVQFISDFLDSIGDLLFWLIRLARSFYFANML